MNRQLKQWLTAVGVVVFLFGVVLGIQALVALLPQQQIELNYTEAVIFSVIGVIMMVVGVKVTFNLR